MRHSAPPASQDFDVVQRLRLPSIARVAIDGKKSSLPLVPLEKLSVSGVNSPLAIYETALT